MRAMPGKTMSGKTTRASVLVTVGCLAALLLCGQSGPGAISGVTMDDFGHPVAQVEVSAKNTATGAVYHATSGSKGEYNVAGLPAGAATIYRP